MKVLVTGGTGLVGYSLQKIAKDIEYEFIFWGSDNCNLLNFPELCEKLNEIKPDIIIHLAANVGGLFKNITQNIKMFEDNLFINMNLIACSRIARVKLVLSCLSTCIFPDKVEYPIVEEQLHNGSPHHSNNGYAYAKRILDIYTQLVNVEHCENEPLFVNFVPTNIYGENDNYNLEDAHVMPALIHKAYLAKQGDEIYKIRGSGNPLRMFIHSDDFARIIFDFINFYQEDKLEKMKELIPLSREKQNNYNFIIADTPEKETTIRNVALAISDAFEIPNDKVEFLTQYPDGQYRKPVSNYRLRRLFKEYNKELIFSDLDCKIRETCDYFKENYDKIRK